jgi:phosphate transport system protein
VGLGGQKVKVMRAALHAELNGLIANLARIVRLASSMINDASIALHQGDLALAERVIAERDDLQTVLDCIEQRCVTVLALQAPVARDLRVVVTALHAVGHVNRMAILARHIAIITRLGHPNAMNSAKVRPLLARMSLLVSQLAEDAATGIEYQDPLCCDRLALADGEVDALHRRLCGILFAEDWSHGVEQAVNTALIGRYYERFADHAVAIARQVHYLTTGRVPQFIAVDTASAASCRS